jgi:hypothetical protein
MTVEPICTDEDLQRAFERLETVFRPNMEQRRRTNETRS